MSLRGILSGEEMDTRSLTNLYKPSRQDRCVIHFVKFCFARRGRCCQMAVEGSSCAINAAWNEKTAASRVGRRKRAVNVANTKQKWHARKVPRSKSEMCKRRGRITGTLSQALFIQQICQRQTRAVMPISGGDCSAQSALLCFVHERCWRQLCVAPHRRFPTGVQ